MLSVRADYVLSSPQLGVPGLNFFNAIWRLLRYEDRGSTGSSDPCLWTDSFVFAESVSDGVGFMSGS
jgi:hypothetical protein